MLVKKMETRNICGVVYGLALSSNNASLNFELNGNKVDICFRAMAFNEGIEFYAPRQTEVMDVKPDLSDWCYVGSINFLCIQDLLKFLSLFETEDGGVHNIAYDFLKEYSLDILNWYLMNL